LGPNIGGISVSDKEMNCKFIITNSRTVVSNYIFVKPGDDPFKTLVNLLATLSEPTLIYCRSPSQANQVAFNLLQSPFFEKNSSLADAIKWMKQNYHEKWLLPLSLERGIGIHHGKVPRALSQFCVRAFNEGKINFLICTSSLIEGVNTKAKNVIIFDNKIAANTKIDFFTFNNIAGRSGRMFEHFIGNVYLFHDPPESTLDTVDFPIFSQSDEVAERILLQMEDNDLKDSSKSRLEKYKNQTILSLKTLKENSTVDAQNQIELAKKLIERIEYYHGFLSWTNVPNYYEVNVSSILIWDYLLQPKRSSLGAKSGSQLAFRINRLLQYRDIKTLIELEIEPYKANKNDDVLTINEKIETVLDFIRSWAMFKYPQALMVLDSIQREIFEKYGYKAGNYSKFAATIQNLFLDSSIIELDEYGIPTQVSMKILSSLDPDGNLDHLIKNLKTINFEKETRLNDFEKEIIIDTLSYI
jgi:hypothetical protein